MFIKIKKFEFNLKLNFYDPENHRCRI